MPKAKYKLRATRVDRVAIVDRPAVPDAQILLYKRQEEVVAEKGATTFQDLPLAERTHRWDKGSAMKRVQKWAGGPAKEDIDWKKFRKAFMWYDSANAENVTAYKLPYADVIKGTLTAVPRAIFAVVGRIRGTNIPTEDKRKVLAHAKKYYKKMDLEFPEVVIKAMSTVDFNARLVIKMSEASVETLQDGFWMSVTDDELDLAGKKNVVKELFNELKVIVKTVLLKLVKKTKAQEQKTPKEDMVRWFKGHLRAVATQRMFDAMRYSVTEMVLMSQHLEDPEGTINEVLDDCMEFSFQMMDAVFTKTIEALPDIDKEGRKISRARLRRLKEAVETLQAVIDEAQVEKGVKPDMEELEKLKEELQAMADSLKSIGETVDTMKSALEEASILLTDEQKAEAEKVKAEEEKKATEDAEAEKTKADEEEAERLKKEEEDKVEAEKQAKEKQEELDGKLKGIEELGARFEKALKTIEEKFSVKTSLDAETETDKSKGDVFAEALKNKDKDN